MYNLGYNIVSMDSSVLWHLWAVVKDIIGPRKQNFSPRLCGGGRVKACLLAGLSTAAYGARLPTQLAQCTCKSIIWNCCYSIILSKTSVKVNLVIKDYLRYRQPMYSSESAQNQMASKVHYLDSSFCTSVQLILLNFNLTLWWEEILHWRSGSLFFYVTL